MYISNSSNAEDGSEASKLKLAEWCCCGVELYAS